MKNEKVNHNVSYYNGIAPDIKHDSTCGRGNTGPGSTDRCRSVDKAAAAATEHAAAQAALDAVKGSMQVGMDTVWVLFTAFLVFFMNLGFAMVESGLCRAKNT